MFLSGFSPVCSCASVEEALGLTWRKGRRAVLALCAHQVWIIAYLLICFYFCPYPLLSRVARGWKLDRRSWTAALGLQRLIHHHMQTCTTTT